MIVRFIRVEPTGVPSVTLNNVTLSGYVPTARAELSQEDRNNEGDFNLDRPVNAGFIDIKGQVDTVIERPATIKFFVSTSEIEYPRVQRIEQEVRITTDEEGNIDCSAGLPMIGLRGIPPISRCFS